MRHRAPAHPVPVGRSRFRHCKNTSAPAGKIIRITVLVTIITVLLRGRPAKAPNTRPVTRSDRRSVRLFCRVAGLPSPRPTHTATGDIRHDRMRPSYCPRSTPPRPDNRARPPRRTAGPTKPSRGFAFCAFIFIFAENDTAHGSSHAPGSGPAIQRTAACGDAPPAGQRHRLLAVPNDGAHPLLLRLLRHLSQGGPLRRSDLRPSAPTTIRRGRSSAWRRGSASASTTGA